MITRLPVFRLVAVVLVLLGAARPVWAQAPGTQPRAFPTRTVDVVNAPGPAK